MSPKRRLAAVAMCVASVLLTGCSVPYAEVPPSYVPAQVLSDGVWVVVAIDGVASVVPAPPTLRWTETGRVIGSGGCNQFSGKYVLESDSLTFNTLAATRMLCVPVPRGQEDMFFKALEQTRRVQLVDGVLQLSDEEGKPLVRMVRASR